MIHICKASFVLSPKATTAEHFMHRLISWEVLCLMILKRGRRGECINERDRGRGTGDKGRKAIFQIMDSIDFIKLFIHNGCFEMSIECNLINLVAVLLVPCPLSPVPFKRKL